MSRIIRFEGNSVSLRVPVLKKVDDAKVAKDMTGATVVAFASFKGTKVDADEAIFTDISAGIASVLFAPGDLTAGKWTVEVEFTFGREVQTFATVVIVNPSGGP